MRIIDWSSDVCSSDLSYEDMAAFRPDLLQSNHLAIIGGGYIGLETAAVARSMGLEVTLIQRSARLMGRATASVTSEFFARYHMDRGVKLMLRSYPRAFEGENGRVCAEIGRASCRERV